MLLKLEGKSFTSLPFSQLLPLLIEEMLAVYDGSKYWDSFTVTNIEWPSALSDMMATALSERKERCRYNFHRFGSGQGYFSGKYEIRLCNNNLNRGDMSGVSSIIQQDKGCCSSWSWKIMSSIH